MNESYAETSVKRKQSPTSVLLKGLLILVTVLVLLFGTMFLGAYAIIAAGVLVLVCVLVFPYFKVEYEYVFCDGQLDFDKIYSGNKRKNALRIDFENVEMMAPVTSHALDSYHHQQVKTVDFTSGMKDQQTPVYAIVLRQGEQLTQILCEPSEKMLAMIKQKTPRKISDY